MSNKYAPPIELTELKSENRVTTSGRFQSFVENMPVLQSEPASSDLQSLPPRCPSNGRADDSDKNDAKATSTTLIARSASLPIDDNRGDTSETEQVTGQSTSLLIDGNSKTTFGAEDVHLAPTSVDMNEKQVSAETDDMHRLSEVRRELEYQPDPQLLRGLWPQILRADAGTAATATGEIVQPADTGEHEAPLIERSAINHSPSPSPAWSDLSLVKRCIRDLGLPSPEGLVLDPDALFDRDEDASEWAGLSSDDDTHGSDMDNVETCKESVAARILPFREYMTSEQAAQADTIVALATLQDRIRRARSVVSGDRARSIITAYEDLQVMEAQHRQLRLEVQSAVVANSDSILRAMFSRAIKTSELTNDDEWHKENVRWDGD